MLSQLSNRYTRMQSFNGTGGRLFNLPQTPGIEISNEMSASVPLSHNQVGQEKGTLTRI
jgi:hypothetical protein